MSEGYNARRSFSRSKVTPRKGETLDVDLGVNTELSQASSGATPLGVAEGRIVSMVAGELVVGVTREGPSATDGALVGVVVVGNSTAKGGAATVERGVAIVGGGVATIVVFGTDVDVVVEPPVME
ncbi:MAG: hypothetical protein ACRDYC_06650 [Acidimicrobiales bacterium]